MLPRVNKHTWTQKINAAMTEREASPRSYYTCNFINAVHREKKKKVLPPGRKSTARTETDKKREGLELYAEALILAAIL